MMKNKLVSLFFALVFLCGVTLPATAETVVFEPDVVSIMESESGNYLDAVYTVPLDTDPTTLQNDKYDYDGITYLFNSVTSETVEGEITKINVRQMVLVRTDDGDLATVQAEQPKSIPYDKDGFTGTLHLDTSATEMNRSALGNAAWRSSAPDSMFTAVWVSESGNNNEEIKETPEYEYRFWYAGTVTHSEPDMLRVTVRYQAQTIPKSGNPTLPFSLSTISVSASTLFEWLKGAQPVLLPALGFALLAILLLVALVILFHKHCKNAVDHDEDMTDCEGDPALQKRKSKRLARPTKIKKDHSAEVMQTEAKAPMPVPDFLKNMERGGTDTLDEEGG